MNWTLMLVRNCRALTVAAIESVLAQDVPTRLLVVNNASDDGVTQYLNGLDPNRVVIIHHFPAKGVSASWNVGLRYLFDELLVPHVLVVNNDVRLRPDTMRLLIADGGLFVTAVGSDNEKSVSPPHTPPRDTTRPHPDFSCFLIRREVWHRVGEFDEGMSIYASDGDYHLRLHNAGIEAYCLDLPFFHYASGTLKQCDPHEMERILAQAEKDRQVFALKWSCAIGSDKYYEHFGHGAPEPQA